MAQRTGCSAREMAVAMDGGGSSLVHGHGYWRLRALVRTGSFRQWCGSVRQGTVEAQGSATVGSGSGWCSGGSDSRVSRGARAAGAGGSGGSGDSGLRYGRENMK